MSPLSGMDAHSVGVFALEVTIKVSLMLLLLSLLDGLCGRRGAAWRSLFWRFGIVAALIIPVASVTLPTHSVWLEAELPRPAFVSDLIESHKFDIDPATLPGPLPNRTPLPAAELKRNSVRAPVSDDSVPWAGLAVAIYGVGVFALFSRLCLGLYHSAQLRRRGQIVEERWTDVLQSLQTHMGSSRHVELIASDLIDIPTQVGVVAPAIVLPQTLISERDDRTIETGIMHELFHVHRLDYLFNVLSAFAAALHWANPLVWLAVRRLRESAEQVCDDLVVEMTGNHELYADTLLHLTKRLTDGKQLALGASMGRSPQIVGRIDRIVRLRGNVSPRTGRIAAITLTALLLTLAGALATTTVQAVHSQPEGEAVASIPSGGKYNTGFHEVQDMIAFSSDRDGRPSDVWLVDDRGDVFMSVTNHDRSEQYVGPRWSQLAWRHPYVDIVNVFIPRYDDILNQTKYIPGF